MSGAWFDWATSLSEAVGRACWQSAVLALIVAVLVAVFRERIAPRWQHLLWAIVLLRLAVVVTPATQMSAFNLAHFRFVTAPEAVNLESEPSSSTPNPTQAIAAANVRRAEVEELPTIPAQVAPTEATIPPAVSVSATNANVAPSSVRPLSVGRSTASWTTLWIAIWSVWVAGVVLAALRLFTASVALQRFHRTCTSVEDPRLLALLGDACRVAKLQRQPRLLLMPTPGSPFVVGIWRPRIYLPASASGDWKRHEVLHVLAHEAAHIRRRDVGCQWILSALRIVYWFHPLVWVVGRQLQHCREAACDDLVAQGLGDRQRRAYGRTLLRITTSQRFSGPMTAAVAPGLCGLFARRNSLATRIRRLASGDTETRWSRILSVGLVATLLLTGLTDATGLNPAGLNAAPIQDERDDAPPNAVSATQPNDQSDDPSSDFVVSGVVFERADMQPMDDVAVTLYSHRGLNSELTKVAETQTDELGRYEFTGLAPPDGNRYERLKYLVEAKAPGMAAGYSNIGWRNASPEGRIYLYENNGRVRGSVVDEQGQPVAGVVVSQVSFLQSDQLGVPSFTTKSDGLFLLLNTPKIGPEQGQRSVIWVVAEHPDYVQGTAKTNQAGLARIVMRRGCRVSGEVLDADSRQPLPGIRVGLLPFEPIENVGERSTLADASGHYQFNVPEGKYKLVLESNELVAAAQILECRDDTTVAAKPLLATTGGWIVGQLIDTSTGKPMPWTVRDPGQLPEQVTLGLYGPSRPVGRLQFQDELAVVDDQGRFRFRAYPGENYPYLYNVRGSRHAFNTLKQPAVIVEADQETTIKLTYTPPLKADEKMAAARAVLDGLPADTEGRVAGILEEFRKLNHTVDDCELWCLLMKELVDIGKPAVPALCRELEATDEQRMMRRLGFALRAIEDPRAVSSLIRALPKTLQPPMSDYGLIVEDFELTKFMQSNQLRPKVGGRHFHFARPVREIHAALYRITKRGDGVETPLSQIKRSEDLRALAEQERIYHRAAQEWADWWAANWQNFGVDEDYRDVDLPELVPRDLGDYPSGLTLSDNATLGGGVSGMVVSPIGDKDERADFFLDLDLGAKPNWPDSLPRDDDSQATITKARNWAAEHGVDLTCVAFRDADGQRSYALQTIGMEVWEIDNFDAKNLERFVSDGKLPEGRKLDGNLLVQRDKSANGKRTVPQSSFLYLTREQGLGVITITDIVTQARDVTGQFMVQPGVGYHRGVRFEYQSIAR